MSTPEVKRSDEIPPKSSPKGSKDYKNLFFFDMVCNLRHFNGSSYQKRFMSPAPKKSKKLDAGTVSINTTHCKLEYEVIKTVIDQNKWKVSSLSQRDNFV